jgi:hypothetical protein
MMVVVVVGLVVVVVVGGMVVGGLVVVVVVTVVVVVVWQFNAAMPTTHGLDVDAVVLAVLGGRVIGIVIRQRGDVQIVRWGAVV